MLTASEQATLHFYQWEYKHRGYYHFDSPVAIELPYVPFQHQSYSNTQKIDDGRVPSLFKRVSKLLSAPIQSEEPKQEILEIKPNFLASSNTPCLAGISLSFPNNIEIFPNRNLEFLNMLSFTKDLVSFEIVGTCDAIAIQIVCSEEDKPRIKSHLQGYFPTIVLRDIEVQDFGFCTDNDIAIADFGVNNEFMRPIQTVDSFAIDPLTSIIATMESLQHDDVAVFQILFKGISSPLAKDITYSVSDGVGGSFFSDAPEMPICAKTKISNPLFSVVIRIATQGKDDYRSQYLAQELSRSISAVSTSEYNKLIPLSNEGYAYDFHHYNLHHRLSNRLGFILNSKELNNFIHYPNKSIVSRKLGFGNVKTKVLPKETIKQTYCLGINQHNSVDTKVMLNDEMRLRHTHIIGSTGVGKSTLIANMMIEDMKQGNGCALFDPHGDIVEDILLRIPEHRKQDVILIDPYDTEFPIGFNILHAKTDAEKIVLSSDIVSAFKRFATSWGDNMSSVLSQAVNTFLESSTGGTLIELKRFLLEDSFRKQFLMTVDDPSIHYYWKHEYGFIKKRISPLLTRIDTFLRPKIVRYMLAQKGGLDFKTCIEEKKIVLIKLSQGLIGEDNSYLLGSLFLSKFNQVAQGRQNLPKHRRHAYYIYCDEFQNFITPSISQMLSGARKYGLGLILAHQEITQIDDYKTLNSVVSNPYIRICFRLGDIDAKKLESGFSFFDQNDLQALGIGQAITRIGGNTNDFNIKTFPLADINKETAHNTRNYIVEQTRDKFCTPRKDVEFLLHQLFNGSNKKEDDKIIVVEDNTIEIKDDIEREEDIVTPTIEDEKVSLDNTSTFEEQKKSYLKEQNQKQQQRKHNALQDFVKTIAMQRGFKTTIEKKLKSNGRVDVELVNDTIVIAVEISVTNSVTYEIKNIKKCLDANYHHVIMISDDKAHLKHIKSEAQNTFTNKEQEKLSFISSSDFAQKLNEIAPIQHTQEERIRGYRVTTNLNHNPKGTTSSLTNIILNAMRKKK